MNKNQITVEEYRLNPAAITQRAIDEGPVEVTKDGKVVMVISVPKSKFNILDLDIEPPEGRPKYNQEWINWIAKHSNSEEDAPPIGKTKKNIFAKIKKFFSKLINLL